jgi:hypothetical protein
MENQLLDSTTTTNWTQLSPSERAGMALALFSTDWQELEITQLAKLCTYAELEGHNIPKNTQAMLAVLQCFEQAGGIETRESETHKLEVRIK